MVAITVRRGGQLLAEYASVYAGDYLEVATEGGSGETLDTLKFLYRWDGWDYSSLFTRVSTASPQQATFVVQQRVDTNPERQDWNAYASWELYINLAGGNPYGARVMFELSAPPPGHDSGAPAPQCFAASARIAMADGSWKAAAEVAPGDAVRVSRLGAAAAAASAIVRHVRRDIAAADASGRAGHAQLYALQGYPSAAVTHRHRVVYDGVLACAGAHPSFAAVTHAPGKAVPLFHFALDVPHAWLVMDAGCGAEILAEPLLG